MRMETLLRGLRRPVHMVAADLNGDGREDLVVSEFGNLKGKLSWWEARRDGDIPPYQEHVLLDRAGAIRTEVRDMTGDGRPDIVALMGQGWEGVYLFINEAAGRFAQRTILQQHPAWGYSYFELVDFDKDGDLDLLTTNGDNGESYGSYGGSPGSPAPHKPYHGVRLYLNNGRSLADAGGAASLPQRRRGKRQGTFQPTLRFRPMSQPRTTPAKRPNTPTQIAVFLARLRSVLSNIFVEAWRLAINQRPPSLTRVADHRPFN